MDRLREQVAICIVNICKVYFLSFYRLKCFEKRGCIFCIPLDRHMYLLPCRCVVSATTVLESYVQIEHLEKERKILYINEAARESQGHLRLRNSEIEAITFQQLPWYQVLPGVRAGTLYSEC